MGQWLHLMLVVIIIIIINIIIIIIIIELPAEIICFDWKLTTTKCFINMSWVFVRMTG